MNKRIILYSVAILFLIGIGSYFFPSSLQVTQVRTNTNHNVSTEELSRVKNLFQKNNIDLGTLAITSVKIDEQGASHIRAEQFYKNLPIFLGGQIIYHFDSSGKALVDSTNPDGTNHIYISGERIGNLGISTEPSISAPTAVRTARESMKSNYFFTAELGFWDLTAGTSNTESNFVLVWRIKPKGADQYPYAIIDANTGKLIRYWNGIIIN